MLVEVLGLTQSIDFSDGSIQNYLNLTLPNGKAVLAAVDDETAAEFVSLSRGDTTTTSSGARMVPPAPPKPVMRSEPDAVADGYSGFSDDAGTVVFGGDATPEDVVQDRLSEAARQVASASLGHEGTEEERAARLGKPAPVPHWNNSRRAPTVTKNEYGYPQLSGSDVSDPGEISGDSDEQDEVQQV